MANGEQENGFFKKLRDRAVMGYIVQSPILILVVVMAMVFQFFDSFYNRFLLEPILGRPIPFAGFAVSVVTALILGTIAESSKRGWAFITYILNHIPLGKYIPEIVESWKKFRTLAKERGMILAPYFRDKSTFWPGVVTGILPKENGGRVISVMFVDLPLPKPLLLSEDDIILTKLTLEEALAYIASGGLGLRLKGRKLKEERLGDFVSRNSAPQVSGSS